MGVDDVAVQSLFRHYLWPCCGYVLLAVVLRRWLARTLDYRPYIRQLYTEATADRRRHVLKELHEQALGVNRPLRVLELGVSTGANLPFYPNGCDLVCLTADQRAETHLRSLLAEDFPNLRLVECVAGGGEVLAGMDARCVDAVVFTHALEAESRPASTLRQVHRVLRPGGRCYLVDHEAVQRWSAAWVVSRLVLPLYRTVGLWSGAGLDTARLLRVTAFSRVQLDSFRVHTAGTLWEMVFVPPWARWNIAGTATK